VRLTYDSGSLEIMTLGHGHERFSKLLGRLVESLTEELDIPVHSGRSTTFKSEAKQRGLEPDECYWIQNEPLMRGKNEFDIESDLPPDLAIEVDITSSSLNRMSIYATLGVKEVWRFGGETLTVSCLETDGSSTPHKRSPTFPSLPLGRVLRFLRDSETRDETSLVKRFRSWVRKHLFPGHKSRPSGSPSSGKRRRPKK
jgi:Uma2 family endonuclease